MKIDEIAADDTLLISWDVNNRTPRLFSKWSTANLNKPDKISHNFTLAEATTASASTPDFFLPFAKFVNNKEQFFISGDNIAPSPAMFAYLNAVEKRGKKPSDIRVVSVGSTNSLPKPFNEQVNLLEWAAAISTMGSPVKETAQDYMTTWMSKKNSRVFHKYQIDTSADWENQFYFFNGNRQTVLQQKYQEMVNANLHDVTAMLKEVIAERFTCQVPIDKNFQ